MTPLGGGDLAASIKKFARDADFELCGVAPVRNFGEAQACDLAAHAAWCRELLARGVYPPPSQFEAWFPSLAHTGEQLERTVEAAAAAFESLERAGVGG